MHTIKTHPLTGEIIKPVGFRKPRLGETAMQPIWPIMGGDENAEAAAAAKAEADKAAADAAAKEKADAEAAAAANAKAGGEQLPYPEGKAVADMTLEEQVAYHKYHSRKHENAWKGKFGDYTPEQVAEMAKRIEEIEAANLSDTEKAVKEAYDRGKAEATAEGASIAVRALVDARKAHLDETKDADIIESLDLLDYSKFITDGSVDSVRLTKVLDRLAPAGGGTGAPRWPNTGQGSKDTGTESARDAGKAEAEKRFGKASV
jgi:hypothetical protein